MQDQPAKHSPTIPISPAVSIHRREFLQVSTTAALGFPAVLTHAKPNQRLQHACIGAGGMGRGDYKNIQQHGKTKIVAVCDVDSERLAKAAGENPGARTYADWRELLEREGNNIDSVNVSVPDHMHFSIAYSAVKRGKHVYCQKPMCHDVAEVRSLTEAAAKAGIRSQLGTQNASNIGSRMAVEYVRRGVIGKVKHVYVCSNRPGAIDKYRFTGPRPNRTEAPPSHLDWDRWLGVAPERPYAPAIYHPSKWRAWQDFGTGWSGDIGCHVMDVPWRALELTAPESVRAEVQLSWRESPTRRSDVWPQSDHITWTFPGTRWTDGELTMEWFDGRMFPPQEIQDLYPGDVYPAESAMMIGTEGAILAPLQTGPLLLPQEKFRGLERPEPAPRNHYHHWLDAIHGGEPNESHFAQTGPMTETVLLGTIAIRTPGEELEWDTEALCITNHQTANRLVSRTYREGWSLAGF